MRMEAICACDKYDYYWNYRGYIDLNGLKQCSMIVISKLDGIMEMERALID